MAISELAIPFKKLRKICPHGGTVIPWQLLNQRKEIVNNVFVSLDLVAPKQNTRQQEIMATSEPFHT